MVITGKMLDNPYNSPEYIKTSEKDGKGNIKHGVNAGLAKLSEEGSINATQLNLGQTDKIEQERDKARRMAMELINSAWDSDAQMESVIDEHRKQKDIISEERTEITDKLGDIAKERKLYEETLAADDDGQEKADLELLRRESEADKNPFLKDSFTDEERERLSKLHEEGLTEYQTHMLRLDSIEDEYNERLDKNNKELEQETRMVRGLELEQLKQHDMVDARKSAQSVLDNANKEITGLIAEEGLDKVEEENEENEKTEKRQEEEAEKIKERIEKSKNNRHEDDNMDEIVKLNSELNSARKTGSGAENINDVQKSLDLVVAQMQLTSEDIKGLVFDVKQGF